MKMRPRDMAGPKIRLLQANGSDGGGERNGSMKNLDTNENVAELVKSRLPTTKPPI